MKDRNPPFEAGLSVLAAKLGSGFERAQVERVDPHRDGHLVFQVEHNGRREWYGSGESGVEPMPVREDAHLPVATHLDGLLESGGARLIAWQPGRRITVGLADGADRRVIKGYRKRRSGDAVRRHRLAVNAVRGTDLVVPFLLEHEADREAMHLEHVEGRRPSLDASAADLFHSLGRGLRSFQQARNGEALPTHGRGEELGVLTRFSNRSLAMRHGLPAGWNRAFEALKAHADRGPGSMLVLAHRDLHDGQLLVEERRIALLDFDLLCLAETGLDAANLCAHLHLRSLQGLHGATHAGADVLGRALLDGLGRADDPGFAESFAFHRASAFLRLALVYYLRPRWDALTPELVDIADRYVQQLAIV